MFAFFRNCLLFSLVTGQEWPENLERICIGRKLIAWTADSAGLFAYPDCKIWAKAKDAWADVVAVDGRPLSEMLRFPQGDCQGMEPSLYLQVCYGIIGPMRLHCQREACRAGRVEAEQWAAYEAEVNKRYLIYDLLDDLTRPSIPLYRKRQKLSQLLELLGPESYNAGRIPSALP